MPLLEGYEFINHIIIIGLLMKIIYSWVNFMAITHVQIMPPNIIKLMMGRYNHSLVVTIKSNVA